MNRNIKIISRNILFFLLLLIVYNQNSHTQIAVNGIGEYQLGISKTGLLSLLAGKRYQVKGDTIITKGGTLLGMKTNEWRFVIASRCLNSIKVDFDTTDGLSGIYYQTLKKHYKKMLGENQQIKQTSGSVSLIWSWVNAANRKVRLRLTLSNNFLYLFIESLENN